MYPRYFPWAVINECFAVEFQSSMLNRLFILYRIAGIRDFSATASRSGTMPTMHLPAHRLCRAGYPVSNRRTVQLQQRIYAQSIRPIDISNSNNRYRHRWSTCLGTTHATQYNLLLRFAVELSQWNDGAVWSVPHSAHRYQQLRQYWLAISGTIHANVEHVLVRCTGPARAISRLQSWAKETSIQLKQLNNKDKVFLQPHSSESTQLLPHPYIRPHNAAIEH